MTNLSVSKLDILLTLILGSQAAKNPNKTTSITSQNNIQREMNLTENIY
jgi:hypothetical protein